MFKIGEFARLNWVTVKTLRHYEKLGLLIPSKVDSFSGYRYYSASKIQVLNKILALKDIGFSLQEVSDLMKYDLSNDEMLGILKLRKTQLQSSIDDELVKLKKVDVLIDSFKKEKNIMYDISVKSVDSLKVASYRGIGNDYSDQGTHWEQLVNHIKEHGAKIMPGCFVSFHPSEDIDGVDIEVFEQINKDIPSSDKVKVQDLEPVPSMASVVIKGAYSGLKDAYAALFKWLEDNSYEVTGLAREIYLEGEWSTDDPNEYVTEIQIPVEKS